MSSRRAAAAPDAAAVLARLQTLANTKVRDGLSRFGLPTERALGIPMAKLNVLRKELGERHDLVDALWGSGWLEARLLAAMLGDPARVTPAQMERWSRDFDNWGVVDTVCFKLWDRTPHAFAKVNEWADRSGEFQRRAAFALLASVALHDRAVADAEFVAALPLCERAATDGRNFVKKGVLWALNAIGRRSPALQRATLTLCEQLASRDDATSRWIGKTALRELGRAGPRIAARHPRQAARSKPARKKASRKS